MTTGSNSPQTASTRSYYSHPQISYNKRKSSRTRVWCGEKNANDFFEILTRMTSSDDQPVSSPPSHTNTPLLLRRIHTFSDQIHAIIREVYMNRIWTTLPFYGSLCYEEEQNKTTLVPRIPRNDKGPECIVLLPYITFFINFCSVRSCRQHFMSTKKL